MKIDRNSRVWINCRTVKEQEEVLDIFGSMGAHWPGRKSLSSIVPRTPPMHFLFENGVVKHGTSLIIKPPHSSSVLIEARDLHNQCISVRRKVNANR